MQQTSHLSRAAHLILAVLLAIAMCVPVYAYADEPADGSVSDATAEQLGSVEESATDQSEGAQPADGDEGPSSDPDASAQLLSSPAPTAAPDDAPAAPAAASAVTMQQGSGEAKGYDSISAAVADAADYNYKTNKDTYVITLNGDVSDNVAIDGKKRVTIDLNGNTLSPAASGPALTVSSTQTVIVKDSVGGGEVVGDGDVALQVAKGGKLTVSGGTVKSDGLSTVVSNEGTLTVSGGSVVSESGMNPTVSNGGTMTVSSGVVAGGNVAISNLGKLTVKGGSVSNTNSGSAAYAILGSSSGSITVSGGEITSPGVAASVNNSASATVSGGTISGAQCGIDAIDSAKVAVSGGALASANGFALSADNAAAVTVSGGEFTSASGMKAINRAFNATVTLSGGTFNVASAADVCDSPVFVDRYSAVEKDGKVAVEMTRPAAVVIAEDGTQTAYETFTKACSNAPAYSTVRLMEDAVLGKYAAEVNAYGVTVDLNGFNIDGTAYTGSKAALTLKTPYGDDPVDGKDSTLRLINGKPETGGKVTAKLPVAGKAGDSTIEAPVFIGEEVELAVANGGTDKVKLESSAYLVYTEKTASFFSNGGFKVDAADGTQRVYGAYSSAAKYAAEGSTVIMLNDFTGNDTIHSGDRVATLDLGGHTYTYTGTQQALYINYDNAGIILKNGTVVATQTLSQAGVAMLYNNGTLTLDHVVMNIAGDSWGIGTNGTNVGNTIVLKDSTLNVPEGLGIYFPSTGSVTIDNSIINAKHFGVQVCAGDLTITGEKTAITATGDPQAKTDGDGPIIDGAAVSVVEREGYQDLGAVAIEGGTFAASDASKAVKTYTFNNTDKVEGEWPDAGSVVVVSGGTFSDPIDEGICADGFAPQQNADGSFGVHEHQYTIVHSDADGHWTECDICGAVTDKQAHAFTVAEHDAENHWMKCEGCDATAEKAAHSFEWVVDREATETEPGSKHEECTECGFAKEVVEIPAIGGGDSGNEPGTGDEQGGSGDQPAGKPGENANQGDTLAQTGDTTAALAGSLVLFSIVSAALLFLARRRVVE